MEADTPPSKKRCLDSEQCDSDEIDLDALEESFVLNDEDSVEDSFADLELDDDAFTQSLRYWPKIKPHFSFFVIGTHPYPFRVNIPIHDQLSLPFYSLSITCS